MSLTRAELAYFENQLQAIEKEVHNVEKAPFNARRLIPLDSSDGEGCGSIKYFQSEGHSPDAVFLAPGQTYIPRVDVSMKEFMVPVVSFALSYGYTVQEIRANAYANQSGVGVSLNLDQARALECRNGIARFENKVLFFGDSDRGISGFLNHPLVPVMSLPNGAAGTATWATKTPAEILKDLFAMTNQMVVNTDGVETPDTLLLPVAQYLLIRTMPMSQDNPMTVLQYFLANNEFIRSVEMVQELKTAKNGTSPIAMVYRRDPSVVRAKIPMPLKQHAAYQDSLFSFQIAMEERIAGCVVYKPLAMLRVEGL